MFYSLHMEMVVLVLWIELPRFSGHLPFLLCALSLFSQVLWDWATSPETSTHHPPSQTCSLYIAGRKVLGAAWLPFSSEQSLWVTFKCDTAAEGTLRGSAVAGGSAWSSQGLRRTSNRSFFPAESPAGCPQPSWHQRPAIKSRKAISGKQRQFSLRLAEGLL